ncbi:MAG: hypothetical protein E7072_07270 [Bacteroidales bacterium]|nr:hypothetical protein [Bacteroidales bacterium]
MAIFNFFKTPKIRQYNVSYRYYDPKKEEREERLKRVQQQIADEKNGGSGLVRKGMFREQSKIKRSSEKSRIIQMAIIAVAIFAIISFMRS